MMKKLGFCLGLTLGSSLFLAMACGDLPGERLTFPVKPEDGSTDGGTDPVLTYLASGPGVGDACDGGSCRPGLTCNGSDECEPDGTTEDGEACLLGAECAAGLTCFLGQCSLPGVTSCPICQEAGDGEQGDGCQSDLDCGSGLRCGLVGLSPECVSSGTADLGAECSLQSDCFQGLFCTDGACSLAPPLWEGVECPPQDDDNVVALFEVPGANATPEETTFFNLPFPSDVRLRENGRPDLSSFPTPGPGLLGTDLVERYVAKIEADSRGWSTNPNILFRFSGAIDGDSLRTPEGEQQRVFVADLDDLPDDPEGGVSRLGYEYTLGGGSNYVCDDWLALRPAGPTLKPGHRYVVWLTTDATSSKGVPVARSPQFAAMLADDAPSGDAILARAHASFQPLRDYLEFYQGSSNEVDPDALLIATVFTTDDSIAPMRKLAEAVTESAVPSATDWVKCGGGTSSPCEQAEEELGRACGTGTDDYDEYQALIELPIFQEGEPPYLETGGAISDSEVRLEKVCMSMSIPKGEAPPEGWPTVVYGHGTGGSYRGALRESVAGRLSRTTPKFATIGYDEVQHGPRRGVGPDAQQPPDNLFFNFMNPDAARGNPMQGAADLLSVIRFLKSGELASATETGDVAITVDPNKIFVFGHSQGSTHASIALPFSDLVGGVLSGNGGGLSDSLMDKSNPVNIAGAIPLAIQDPDSTGRLIMREKHPVMGLLQHYIDPADPVNYAPLLFLRPEENNGPKSVLQTFGLRDTYSPESTLRGFVIAAGMPLAPAPSGLSTSGESDLNYLVQNAPVSGNVSVDETSATVVCRQYDPGADDGHFVVHNVAQANDDAIGFLESLGNDELPTVPVQ